MKGNELLDKMELVDPAYIAEADTYTGRKRIRSYKWFVLAACLVLIAGTTTVLAATGVGTNIIQWFTLGSDSNDESGYVLSADVVKFPEDGLKGQIREVPAVIKEQFAAYEPYMSWFPGCFSKTFGSRDEACDYVGLDGLQKITWDLEEGGSTLNVYGDEDGSIQSVDIETTYTEGDMRLQFFTTIYTENYTDEITTGVASTEYLEFTESFYTTANGLGLHVIESTPLESGYICIEGYLVKDGVLYQLNIAHTEKDKEQAKKLLYQWADLF